MARDRNREQNEANSAPAEVTEAPAVAAAPEAGAAPAAATPSTDNRAKKVKDPDTGESVNRADMIRKLCRPTTEGGKGLSRSEATKRMREITGDPNLRYQIIFQATKGMPNLKASERAKPQAATPAPADASAQSGGEAGASQG